MITIDILKRLAKDSFTNKKASYSYDAAYHFHIMIEGTAAFSYVRDSYVFQEVLSFFA